MALLTARSLGLVFIVGPLASLLGLQLAVCASSRVNDPRSAQQLGALVLIIPVGILQVAQFVGGIVLTAPILLAISAVLAVGNLLVLRAAIATLRPRIDSHSMEVETSVVGHPYQGCPRFRRSAAWSASSSSTRATRSSTNRRLRRNGRRSTSPRLRTLAPPSTSTSAFSTSCARQVRPFTCCRGLPQPRWTRCTRATRRS